MNNSLYTFLLGFSVLLIGCSRSELESETAALVKEPPAMIQIDNFSVTGKILTLDYQVTNIFEDGIWVCYDTWVHGEKGTQNTSTRVEEGVIRIRLCFNLESVGGFVLENPPGVAKYVWLRPGESCPGKVVRKLPIRDYVREWRAERKNHMETVLHRVVFEVGYFAPKWNDYFTRVSDSIKKEPDKSKPVISGPFYYLSLTPFITEEQLESKLRKVFYIADYTPIVTNEESTEVLITDVDIPCSVVVEEE